MKLPLTLVTLLSTALAIPNSFISCATEPTNPPRPCGFKIAPCEQGYYCSASDPSCPATRHENCAGQCMPGTAAATPTAYVRTTTSSRKYTLPPGVTPTYLTFTDVPSTRPTSAPRPPHSYKSCGGHRVSPVNCDAGETCIDDPWRGGCGQACDMPGICVNLEEAKFCGGYAGLGCPEGKRCVDDPRDGCDPRGRGRDCGGKCI
jgi:hypothetical protein